MTNEEYMAWMTNPDNSHKCDTCPENINADNWQNRLPCGQWHCWVDCHTERGAGRMSDERFKRECEEVKRLGDQIGYGNMMTIASALWAKMLIDEEFGDSGAFYPTILSNMKPGELTIYAMNERAEYLKLFKSWGW